MSGWNYPDDSHHGPWDGPGYESDRPDPSDFAEEDFWNEKDQKYPRGYGPPNDSEDGYSPFHVEDEAPDEDAINPGFREREVDTHYDPDHGREDKIGGILTQAQQWPDRVAAYQRVAYDGHGKTESELSAKKHKPPVGGDVVRLKGEDTGLYGEDEDDTYDVYAKPNPKGDGWDVVKPIKN